MSTTFRLTGFDKEPSQFDIEFREALAKEIKRQWDKRMAGIFMSDQTEQPNLSAAIDEWERLLQGLHDTGDVDMGALMTSVIQIVDRIRAGEDDDRIHTPYVEAEPTTELIEYPKDLV